MNIYLGLIKREVKFSISGEVLLSLSVSGACCILLLCFALSWPSKFLSIDKY